jgi:hypothetical protein
MRDAAIDPVDFHPIHKKRAHTSHLPHFYRDRALLDLSLEASISNGDRVRRAQSEIKEKTCKTTKAVATS